MSQCRRVCLFNYNAADDTIDWRHYYVSYSSKDDGGRDVTTSAIENDVLDELSREGAQPDEEDVDAADGATRKTKKKRSSNKRGVNLREMGPRLTLKLHKIYEGVNDGEVLYHSMIKKSAEEILELRKRHENKRALKEKRKRLQDENVEKKEAERQQKLELREKKKKQAQREMERKVLGEDDEDEIGYEHVSDDDDDSSDVEAPEEKAKVAGNKRKRAEKSRNKKVDGKKKKKKF